MLIAALICVGCVSQRSDCSLDTLAKPPHGAEVVRTHGADFVLFPANLEERFSGCQKYWLGDGDHPSQMKMMMALRFHDGQLVSLIAREPKKPEYSCKYNDGTLVESKSRNARWCPAAEQFKLGPGALRPNTSLERTREE